ncbi:MAG: type II toxin-antitoxin system prevent-host-death family antitoxin [Acidimicrobiia bacterium]|nr:type II toxin-antitoxin system prevent-host-death family antitoxin [Acidimicrobiia bacterium]MYF83311.1 type II toxin-antitoxin system prevent-host-death family antitoxin [Acidimicrobiia bacterium]
MIDSGAERTWTVAEAKGRLSEILRLAETEGPQQIGVRRSFVVVPAATWYEKVPPRQALGKWLIENVPRGLNLDVPSGRGSAREIPFNEQAPD